MYVNLLDFRSGVQQIRAVIRVEQGEVRIHTPLQMKPLPPHILETVNECRQHFPNTFLEELPKVFSGTYLRAELRDD